MINLKFNLKIVNDRLRIDGFSTARSGSVNEYLCEFEFTADWDDLDKFAVFKMSEHVVGPVSIQGNCCVMPYELFLDAGDIYVGVYGIQNAENYKRFTTNWVKINVGEGAYCEGTAPETPTPDIWESYWAQVQEAVESANESALAAKNGAAEVENAKDKVLAAQKQTAEDMQKTRADAAQTDADRKAVSEDKTAVLAAKGEALDAKLQAEAAKQSAGSSAAAVDAVKAQIDQQAAYIQREVDRIESLDTYTKAEMDSRLDKRWTLIDETTLETDIGSYAISGETTGDYKEFYFEINGGLATASTGAAIAINYAYADLVLKFITSTNTFFSGYILDSGVDGYLKGILSESSRVEGYYNAGTYIGHVSAKKHTYGARLKISTNNTNLYMFKAGTVIKVWGRK